MDTLKGTVALITGSSRGIGAAIAKLFAEEGARVALHGRDSKALDAMQNNIERGGGKATQVIADVTRFDELEAARRLIEEQLGPIDILVANAGANLVIPGPLEETSEEGWRATVDANLTATFLTIKCVLPGMKQRKSGNIVTVSSAAARRPNARSPIAYAAAKAGIQILTQDVAAQAGPYGIRANCICPETILTERNAQHIPDAAKKEMAGSHPIQRLGTPDDVARAALYLSSEHASWVTGIILDVAGGSVMV